MAINTEQLNFIYVCPNFEEDPVNRLKHGYLPPKNECLINPSHSTLTSIVLGTLIVCAGIVAANLLAIPHAYQWIGWTALSLTGGSSLAYLTYRKLLQKPEDKLDAEGADPGLGSSEIPRCSGDMDFQST